MDLIIRLFWICLLHEYFVSGYNIEGRLPLYKGGPAGSTFGFSVVMHKTTATPQTFVDGSILVIGSPTAEELPTQPNTERPGGIYYCPVTTNRRDCSRIYMDNGPSNQENGNKTDEWLGVQVKSQGPGGYLVACAHRFSRHKDQGKSERQSVCGKCFLLNGTTRNTIEDVTESVQDIFVSSPCNDNSYEKNRYAFTQAGTSLAIDKGEYFFGGPGSYAWAGAIYGNSFPDQSTFFKNELYQSPGCTKQEINAKKKKIKCDNIPLRRDSLIGFSLTISDAMTSYNETYYIAGAPRGNFTGAVVMYTKPEKGSSNHELDVLNKQILLGEQTGSSFGYSVITTDLNKDGLDDLIVGAPQYFNYTENHGGAVYIYFNKRVGKFSFIKPVKLVGTNGSFFGQSLTALGDIDQDGYNDFAIGAPFDGSGKVYIYTGSPSESVTLSQVLDGRNYTGLTPSMTGFGVSLSGNVDIDNNKYPDLFVGTLKDQAILFRARPIISVNASLTLSKQVIDLTKPDCSQTRNKKSCFSLEVCFEYKSKHYQYAAALPVIYNIFLDSEVAKNNPKSRIRFLSPKGTTTFKQEIVIPRSEVKHCLSNMTVSFRSEVQDKLSPVDVYFEFSLKSDADTVSPQQEGERLIEMIEDPILDRALSKTITKTVLIKNNCKDDGCQSDLKINGSIPKELILGINGKAVLTLDVSNPGEEAHQASVSIELPRRVFFVNFSRPEASDAEISCSPRSTTNFSTLTCNLGNPYSSGNTDKIKLLFDISSLIPEDEKVVFKIKGSTTSDNSEPVSQTLESVLVGKLNLSLTGYGNPQQVRYTKAPIKGSSAIVYWDEIGPLISYTFTVKNEGKLVSNDTFLKIDFPRDINNGKWLLYIFRTLVRVGAAELNGKCKGFNTNPLGYKPPLPSGGRSKRQAEKNKPLYQSVRKATPFTSGPSRSTLHLNCQNTTAQCVTIVCNLEPLENGRSESIVLQTRLWNATFLEEFKNVDLVYVGVYAEIKSQIPNIEIVGNPKSKQIETVVDHAFFEEDASPTFPWWYILIGIIFALIIYILIICLLKKCGFFKRKKYPDHPVPDKEELIEEHHKNEDDKM